jgi:nicotinate phosphoribosyltransferase
MSHSWIQSFDNEYEAFRAYALAYPNSCTFLVDTYNVLKSGVPNAIRVFDEVLKPMGIRPKGIRIDSGDITYLTKKTRKMLDAAGYNDVGIVVSNSLDEYIIRDLLLQGACVDIFGVGERLITAKSESVFGGVCGAAGHGLRLRRQYAVRIHTLCVFDRRSLVYAGRFHRHEDRHVLQRPHGAGCL